jgi:hypothetical protein
VNPLLISPLEGRAPWLTSVSWKGDLGHKLNYVMCKDNKWSQPPSPVALPVNPHPKQEFWKLTCGNTEDQVYVSG